MHIIKWKQVPTPKGKKKIFRFNKAYPRIQPDLWQSYLFLIMYRKKVKLHMNQLASEHPLKHLQTSQFNLKEKQILEHSYTPIPPQVPTHFHLLFFQRYKPAISI